MRNAIESGDQPYEKRAFRRFFSNLGPGLITGAADDDPSGTSKNAPWDATWPAAEGRRATS
jgi:Mn2+/Fe2+ NRAMP family transporter